MRPKERDMTTLELNRIDVLALEAALDYYTRNVDDEDAELMLDRIRDLRKEVGA